MKHTPLPKYFPLDCPRDTLLGKFGFEICHDANGQDSGMLTANASHAIGWTLDVCHRTSVSCGHPEQPCASSHHNQACCRSLSYRSPVVWLELGWIHYSYFENRAFPKRHLTLFPG